MCFVLLILFTYLFNWKERQLRKKEVPIIVAEQSKISIAYIGRIKRIFIFYFD